MTEEAARRWPDLMAIVEEKVRPERERQNDRGAKEKWWQFIRTRPALYGEIAASKRVLVVGQTSKYRSLASLPGGMIYDQKLIVFPFESSAVLCVLHSRVHEHWAVFLGSSMKDDPVYTPSDCCETFPFPENWQTTPILEAAGQTYYDFRAEQMIANDEGLTKTYNRFHDPNERLPDIRKLRQLHEPWTVPSSTPMVGRTSSRSLGSCSTTRTKGRGTVQPPEEALALSLA